MRTKKATPKAKATPKKATAIGKNKATTKEQMASSLKTQTASIKLLKGTATKRPPNNPDVPQDIIDMLNTDFNSILELLDSFSQHLRALDRMRLNGVGIKKLGFIERAYELALENGEFLPHYLTLER